MTQARRIKRAKNRANIKHDPTLRRLVMDCVVYLDTTDDKIETVNGIIETYHIHWLSYCGGTTANRDAFVDNIYKFMKV